MIFNSSEILFEIIHIHKRINQIKRTESFSSTIEFPNNPNLFVDKTDLTSSKNPKKTVMMLVLFVISVL